MDIRRTKSGSPRSGMAMILVLGLGLVVLALGMAMLTTSGGLLKNTVDNKERIRARYAAEAMIAISIAETVEKANEYFGATLKVDAKGKQEMETGDGVMASAEFPDRSSEKPVQEMIAEGRLKGMMGLKIPILIEATGQSKGNAKAQIDADVGLYQVPIFQFGVFYEGNLEISPGPDMNIFGPVHTNSNAYFRAAGTVTFQGPVTASGTIYHWYRGSGIMRYHLTPDTVKYLQPSLSSSMTALNAATKPVAIAGVFNVDQGREKLVMPIGGTQPRNLIGLRDNFDNDALKFQKYDWKIACSTGTTVCGKGRWVNDVNARPAWISGPRVFFDRREDRWVKIWDFDVAALVAAGNMDSIFYLADTVLFARDSGTKKSFLLNAFRIVNATHLPRNMTIASANPVYIQGNFNLANPTGSCKPADHSGTVPDSLKYCNAQIAADAVTLLSPNWPNLTRAIAGMNGSLEQDASADRWTNYVSRRKVGSRYDTTWASEPTTGSSGSFTSGTVRVNAAIFTGNKPSNPAVLAPNNYSESTFENGYEGGWHNTIRFLERLAGATVVFKGSFVCMWKAESMGLDISTSTVSIRGGHYEPPNRVWGFDPRFRNLNNMPPGTPFLATAIFTNWQERR